MERGPVSLRLGETLHHESGVIIRASKIQKSPRRVGSVALHEAAHVVVAGQIDKATIVPSGDYQGATWPVHMTAESAMAAHAMGFDGTGWDRHLTEHILGVDPGAAAASAASILAGKQDEMQLVAEELEEHGTIGQAHVDKAFTQAQDMRSGNIAAEVTVEKPGDAKEQFIVKAENHTVMVPKEWYAVAEKAA